MTFDEVNHKIKTQYNAIKNKKEIAEISSRVKNHLQSGTETVKNYVGEHVDEQEIKQAGQTIYKSSKETGRQLWHRTKKTFKHAVRDLDRKVNGASVHDDQNKRG